MKYSALRSACRTVVFSTVALSTSFLPTAAYAADDALNNLYFSLGYTTLDPETEIGDIGFTAVADVNTAFGTVTDVPVSGSLAGPDVDVSSTTFPSLLIGYRFPQNQLWSLQTILAVPGTMEITLDESFQVTGLELPEISGDLAEIKMASPSVNLVRHFRGGEKFQPYVGAGLVYITALDAEITNDTLKEYGNPELEIGDSVGLMLQAGLEYNVTSNWWLKGDIRYVTGANADVTVSGLNVPADTDEVAIPVIGTVQGEATVDTLSTDASISALALTVGVGYEF